MPGRSRYDHLPVETALVADGSGGTREVRHLAPRAPGELDAVQPMARHRVAEDDRVDLVAQRYLGDPQAWWRICDDNAALDPDALIGPDNEGRVIVIGVPRA
ncbi:MAG: hypothetical protein JNL54_20780 [Kineosporiaceae bacterium]|nr:hypothetical protein [Kineosporiaceae bacterium]